MAEGRNRTAGGTRRPPYADVPAPPRARRPGGEPPRLVDGSRFWDPEPLYDDLPSRRPGALTGVAAVVGAVTLLGLAGAAAWHVWPASGGAAAHGSGAAVRPGDPAPLSPPAPTPEAGRTGPAADAPPTPPPRSQAATPPRAGRPAEGRTAEPGASRPPGDAPRVRHPAPDPPVRVPKVPPAISRRDGSAAQGRARPRIPDRAPQETPRRGDAARDAGPGRDARGGERRTGGKPALRSGSGGGRETVPRSRSNPRDSAKRAAERRKPRDPGRRARTGVDRDPLGDPRDPFSAAYVCRRFAPTDWRYPYCVRIWNDYRRQTGLDR